MNHEMTHMEWDCEGVSWYQDNYLWALICTPASCQICSLIAYLSFEHLKTRMNLQMYAYGNASVQALES